jgi:dienelactone hydrolase
MVRRVGAALEVLASHPQVDGQVVAVGYCFGGLVVLELARSGADIAGAISVHGSLATRDHAREGDIKTKILICHGALDPFVPATQLTEFMDEMNGARADWQLVVYGGAMHGFTHEAGAATPGVAYNAAADTRSFAAMKAFMAEVFGPHFAGGENYRRAVPRQTPAVRVGNRTAG